MARAKLREIAEAATRDPKQALLDSLGDISGIELFRNRLMVAVYIAPEKTKGGIYRPDRNIQEDRFQAKVGLVVKKGPLAFVDDDVVKFGGVAPEIGDWVMFTPGDGHELYSVDQSDGGTSCRIFRDTDIEGRTDRPEAIW